MDAHPMDDATRELAALQDRQQAGEDVAAEADAVAARFAQAGDDDEAVIDPDCQAGKHETRDEDGKRTGGCVGGPCTCWCHPPATADLLDQADAMLAAAARAAVAITAARPVPDPRLGETFSDLAPADCRMLPLPAWPGPDRARQVTRALHMIVNRAALPDVIGRAAVVLLAPPGAPELEAVMGARLCPGYEGKGVKCSGCRRYWRATVEEPYFNATSLANGKCAACTALTDARPDSAMPVLTGVVMEK